MFQNYNYVVRNCKKNVSDPNFYATHRSRRPLKFQTMNFDSFSQTKYNVEERENDLFARNSNFLIHISLQLGCENLRLFNITEF